MSAKAKHVFFSAQRIISWERLRHGATVIEKSKCLKSWLWQIIKLGGFATVDTAVEVINLEESNKMMSGYAGSNLMGNKEADEAVGG